MTHEELIEKVAEVIYDAMRFDCDDDTPDWEPYDKTLAQEHAREYARDAIRIVGKTANQSIASVGEVAFQAGGKHLEGKMIGFLQSQNEIQSLTQGEQTK